MLGKSVQHPGDFLGFSRKPELEEELAEGLDKVEVREGKEGNEGFEDEFVEVDPLSEVGTDRGFGQA